MQYAWQLITHIHMHHINLSTQTTANTHQMSKSATWIHYVCISVPNLYDVVFYSFFFFICFSEKRFSHAMRSLHHVYTIRNSFVNVFQQNSFRLSIFIWNATEIAAFPMVGICALLASRRWKVFNRHYSQYCNMWVHAFMTRFTFNTRYSSFINDFRIFISFHILKWGWNAIAWQMQKFNCSPWNVETCNCSNFEYHRSGSIDLSIIVILWNCETRFLNFYMHWILHQLYIHYVPFQLFPMRWLCLQFYVVVFPFDGVSIECFTLS